METLDLIHFSHPNNSRVKIHIKFDDRVGSFRKGKNEQFVAINLRK